MALGVPLAWIRPDWTPPRDGDPAKMYVILALVPTCQNVDEPKSGTPRCDVAKLESQEAGVAEMATPLGF